MPFARQLLVLGILLTGTAWSAPAPNWSWNHQDTSLALLNHDKIVWRLNFGSDEPKPNFHPLATIDGKALTAYEPTDHPWHRGLWWSWKYINGLNYWEENKETRTSPGLTQLIGSKTRPSDDFSARITLTIQYHPPGEPALLTETRHLVVTPPDDKGTYLIDWTSEFTAGDTAVSLDRTPPPHEGGPRHGGYAGLSLRFATAFDDLSCIGIGGETAAEAAHGKAARWLAIADATSGIAIFDHPENLRHPQPWYVHNTASMRFFSPSPIFNDPLRIAPGKKITFRYRVMVNSQPVPQGELDLAWKSFASMENTEPQPNPQNQP